MCQYFSKTKDKEVFEKNKHHYDTMKTIAKVYLATWVFWPAYSLHHFPDKRGQVLLPEKRLSKLPDDEISNIDGYMERPNVTFCNGKQSILNDFCLLGRIFSMLHTWK